MLQIFRETKESELQNLLRAKRDLETKLARLGVSFLEDSEGASRLEVGTVHIRYDCVFISYAYE